MNLHLGQQQKPIQTRDTIFRAAVLASFLLLLGLGPAAALVSFDFETPYLVHPDLQVWDFCLVQQDGQYHAFYGTVLPQIQHPSTSDTIWHAVSDDLIRWTINGPTITGGPDAWDARDQAGRSLPSGTYFCQVIHDGALSAGVRLILVK